MPVARERCYDSGTPTSCEGNEIRMRNMEGVAIGQMDGEGDEWSLVHNATQIIHRHNKS
jgi:hypothetical protein